MTDRAADWIGVAAALYVIATFRRIVRSTAASLHNVQQILKEAWSAPALEMQLITESAILDFQRDMGHQVLGLVKAYEDPAPMIPGGWGERWGRRQARRRAQRLRRFRGARRAVGRALTLPPPS